MPERVLDAFHDAAEVADFLLGDTGAEHGELDGLGNGVEADRDGHQTDAVPEKKLTEGVALDAGDRIQADGGEHQADTAGNDAFKNVFAAQSGDEGYAENRQHEKFRRAEGKHERPNDRHGGAKGNAGKYGAHQRTHQHGA